MSIQIDRADLNRQIDRFDRSVRKFIHSFEGDTREITHKIGVDLWVEVMTKTPVDTGRAKFGWALDVAVTNYCPPPGHYSEPTTPNPPLSDTLYLFNNIKYILPLEMGHSRQAAAGMVRPALIKYHDAFKVNLKARFGQYWRLP